MKAWSLLSNKKLTCSYVAFITLTWFHVSLANMIVYIRILRVWLRIVPRSQKMNSNQESAWATEASQIMRPTLAQGDLMYRHSSRCCLVICASGTGGLVNGTIARQSNFLVLAHLSSIQYFSAQLSKFSVVFAALVSSSAAGCMKVFASWHFRHMASLNILFALQ